MCMKANSEVEMESGNMDVVSLLTKLQGQNICCDMSCVCCVYQINCIFLNIEKHIDDDMSCKELL